MIVDAFGSKSGGDRQIGAGTTINDLLARIADYRFCVVSRNNQKDYVVIKTEALEQVELTDEEVFAGHLGGKLSVETTTALDTQRALSIAYTPG
ncbi:hypothetical protein R3Q59_41755, partial [Rhodococcus jostii]|nr:hypothetical protein [Rhodococcus jostii]